MLSTEGRISQWGSFNAFLTGNIEHLPSWRLMYMRRPGPPCGEDIVGVRWKRAIRLAYERGGSAKAAMALVSLAPSPPNDTPLGVLRNKNLCKGPHEIREAREKAIEIAWQLQSLEEVLREEAWV